MSIFLPSSGVWNLFISHSGNWANPSSVQLLICFKIILIPQYSIWNKHIHSNSNLAPRKKNSVYRIYFFIAKFFTNLQYTCQCNWINSQNKLSIFHLSLCLVKLNFVSYSGKTHNYILFNEVIISSNNFTNRKII